MCESLRNAGSENSDCSWVKISVVHPGHTLLIIPLSFQDQERIYKDNKSVTFSGIPVFPNNVLSREWYKTTCTEEVASSLIANLFS